MNISRGFLIIGCLYLIVGISFGIMMGGSGDTTMTPVHAHLNLRNGCGRLGHDKIDTVNNATGS